MAGKKQEESGKVTPLMQQYFKVKAKHPEAVLLFRVGDFYETFGEDAEKASAALGIVLTSRNNGGSDIALAGFPHHSLETYLPRLVKAGYKVAICEQLEKPSPLNKIVRRGVTEVVTPGIASDDKLLDHKKNNYLASLVWGKKQHFGLSFLDVSTGEFLATEGNQEYVSNLLQSFSPAEVVLAKEHRASFDQGFGTGYRVSLLDEWVFTLDFARERLLQHFKVQNLKGFGVEELETAQMAAGAILQYLTMNESHRVAHIRQLSRIQADKYVWLDRFTLRNLELLHTPHETGKSLIQILDATISPMGSRLLKKWVALPLKDLSAIQARQDAVTYFYEQPDVTRALEPMIRQIGDLERLIAKVSLAKINPRELKQLQRAMDIIPQVMQVLTDSENMALKRMGETLQTCDDLRSLLRQSLVEEPPVSLNKGEVIAKGVSEELDDLRYTIQNSKDILLEIQQRESQASGIPSLKIGFNNVFGYYLEVTNKYKDLTPSTWHRKQTLANGERFITDELKVLEAKILGAEEKIGELEESLYLHLVQQAALYIEPIQHNATVLARVDCLLSFAFSAHKNRYHRPTLNDGLIIDIKGGRHPVIEQFLPLGEQFVPNDVLLDSEDQQIMMVTGPNMSGKSALLRQTALICIMAQIGSYVPAEEAHLGIVDKVFTRVGASDNISQGESTFMVEMSETASIMNNISDRSLILLDEIGRGTATYDGISIAWSIAEYLHNNGFAAPKTLFATHYHELNELAEKFPRIRNYHVATREVGQQVLFLRKLMPGGSEHSFGIHVARLAGMPDSIVERANQVLAQLEQKFIAQDDQATPQGSRQIAKGIETPMQLNIYEAADPRLEEVLKRLKASDINAMTPIDCMLLVRELKNLLL